MGGAIMSTKQLLIKEIEALPSHLLEEIYDFVNFLKIKKIQDSENSDVLFASERVLANDWLLPEEDAAWASL